MIYAPKRFLFIHIPRTAGMSITQSLSQACIGHADCIIATCGPLDSIFHRHATANELKHYISDWNNIFKFAVYRTDAEITASMNRLREHDLKLGVHLRAECNKQYRQWLLDPTPIELQDTWNHWCDDPTIFKLPYTQLRSSWSWICSQCKVPYQRLTKVNVRTITSVQ